MNLVVIPFLVLMIAGSTLNLANPKLCEDCLGYDGKVFYGDSVRYEFPYLRIIDENTINPNVHPHCECF
jgi:hypothetical protein